MMTMMTILKLIQHNQFSTRSVNQSPSHLESCDCAAMLSAAMLAATAIGLFFGFGSMATGLDNDSEGLELAAFDATAWPAALVGLLPGVFVIAFAALSVVYAFRVFGRFAGRPGFAPLVDEAHETAQVDVPAPLSVEFFEECFVGDTVNLSALSTLHVPHDFLAGYVFEYGLVADIRVAAAAFAQRNDQMTKQAAATLKAEGWNVLKQLAVIGGLHAATLFVLDATASLACLFAASALPVAVGGFLPLMGLIPWVPETVVFCLL